MDITDANVREVCEALADYVGNLLGEDWEQSVYNIVDALDELDELTGVEDEED